MHPYQANEEIGWPEYTNTKGRGKLETVLSISEDARVAAALVGISLHHRSTQQHSTGVYSGTSRTGLHVCRCELFIWFTELCPINHTSISWFVFPRHVYRSCISRKYCNCPGKLPFIEYETRVTSQSYAWVVSPPTTSMILSKDETAYMDVNPCLFWHAWQCCQAPIVAKRPDWWPSVHRTNYILFDKLNWLHNRQFALALTVTLIQSS